MKITCCLISWSPDFFWRVAQGEYAPPPPPAPDRQQLRHRTRQPQAPRMVISVAWAARPAARCQTIDLSSLNENLQLFNTSEGRYPKDLNELVTNALHQPGARRACPA